MIAARIWWLDEFEWQKSAQSFINDDGRTHFHVLCDGPLFDGKICKVLRAPTTLGKVMKSDEK